jgi:hypothetical protein
MVLADVSTIEVRLHLPPMPKAKTTSTIVSEITCASILVAIAEKQPDGVTVRGITEKSGETNRVCPCLVRLCAGSCQVLKRQAKEPKLNDDDPFVFNPAFTQAKERVVIPQVDKPKDR